MPLLTYRYRGQDRTGQRTSGHVQASDEHQAEIQVRELGLARVVISRVREKRELPAWRLSLARALRGLFSFALYRVSYRELALWSRSLHFAFKAGMNPYQALHLVGDGSSNPTLRRVCELMAARALEGETLSPVLAEYPTAFPTFVRSLLQVAEETGALEVTFLRLADFFEHMHELVLMQKRMTFYPKLLLVAFLLLGGFITHLPFTVPFLGLGAGGPVALAWNLALLVLGALGVLVALLWVLRAVPNRLIEALDRVKMSIPWVGTALYKSALARWGKALALLADAGVPLHRAVVSSASALGNRLMERTLLAHADALLAGQPLSQVLRATGDYPPELVEMVQVGESSGNLGAAIESVAKYYEQESRVGQKQVVTATAVGFYCLIAALIGLFVVSFWLGYAGGVGSLLK